MSVSKTVNVCSCVGVCMCELHMCVGVGICELISVYVYAYACRRGDVALLAKGSVSVQH